MTLEDIKAIAPGLITTGSLVALWWLDQGDRMERYLGPIIDRVYGALGGPLRRVASALLVLLGVVLFVASIATLLGGMFIITLILWAVVAAISAVVQEMNPN